MLNKKLLAASIAVAFSSSTFAVDLTAEEPAAVVFEQSIAADAATDGVVEITNAGTDVASDFATSNGIADVTFETGFSIGAGTSKYVLIELTNATFVSAPVLYSENANATTSISTGGGEGDASVIFEVAAGATGITTDEALKLAAADYDLEVGKDFTITATLYEDAGDAVNKVANSSLAVSSGTVATFGTSLTGNFTDAEDAVALVATDFTGFAVDGNGDLNPAIVGELGTIDVSALAGSTPSLTPAGTAVTFEDFLSSDTQDVVIEGDFSAGTWELRNDNCTGTAVTGVTVTDTKLIAADLPLVTTGTAEVYALCTTPALAQGSTTVYEAYAKGSYTASLQDFEGSMGSIVYDTLSVNVPYLTTFGDYNQRIYIVNSSAVDVDYSFTSFLSEEGNEAEAGDKAEGTVPAKGMIAVKATDIVSLQNQTRTSATLELDAQPAVITVTTQTVNIGGDNATDTVVLHQPSN